jgi:hypothetical protein
MHGSINLYSLQTVDNDLIVENCENCLAKDRTGHVRDNVPFVYFGSLRSVGYIKIAGVLDVYVIHTTLAPTYVCLTYLVTGKGKLEVNTDI